MERVKKVIKIFSTFVLALSVVIPFSFDVKAAVTTYTHYLNEPQIVEGSGYLVFIMENTSTGSRVPYVIQWFTSNSVTTDGVNNGNFVDIIMRDQEIIIYFNANTGTVTRGTVLYWRQDACEVKNITVSSDETSFTYNKTLGTNYKIVGYQAYGTIGHLYNQTTTNEPFEIEWANDTTYQDDMNQIISILNENNIVLDNIDLDLDQIKTYLSTIQNQLGSVNSNLVNIYNKIDTFISDMKAQFNYQNGLIQNFTTIVQDKFNELISSINGNGDENVDDEISNKNDEFTSSSDEYLELEDSFNNNLNTSLDNIDPTIDLFNGSDFLATSSFISTNINKIVTSNAHYESFIMMGLILGLALFLIGKRVI